MYVITHAHIETQKYTHTTLNIKTLDSILLSKFNVCYYTHAHTDTHTQH